MIRKFLGFVILILCLILSKQAFSEDLKVGSINMRKVFYEYKKTKDFNERLEKEDEIVKKEIEKKTENLRKLRDEIDLLSEKAKEKREPELRKKIRELDDFRKDKIEGLIQEKDEMFKEIRKDVFDVSATYAKKNGYNIILDEAVFVYRSDKYDITSDIIEELNK